MFEFELKHYAKNSVKCTKNLRNIIVKNMKENIILSNLCKDMVFFLKLKTSRLRFCNKKKLFFGNFQVVSTLNIKKSRNRHEISERTVSQKDKVILTFQIYVISFLPVLMLASDS